MMPPFPATINRIDDLRRLFYENVPIIDVRTTQEFASFSVPNSANLPLLEEANLGQTSKSKEGDSWHDINIQVLETYEKFLETHPNSVLSCSRDGRRCAVIQHYLLEYTHGKIPSVEGGIYTLQQFLLDESEYLSCKTDFFLLSGRTGCGKTRLLKKLQNTLNLECLTNHRGSAFGTVATEQPSQDNFENNLSYAQIQLDKHRARQVLLEDENPHIGSIHLPEHLYEKMSYAPVILMDVSHQSRLNTSLQEYVIDTLEGYSVLYDEEQAFFLYRQSILDSLQKIRKRLGEELYKKLKLLAENGFNQQQITGSVDMHRPWIGTLLHDYYDPLYDYQIRNKKNQIIFSGDDIEVAEYWQSCFVNQQ